MHENKTFVYAATNTVPTKYLSSYLEKNHSLNSDLLKDFTHSWCVCVSKAKLSNEYVCGMTIVNEETDISAQDIKLILDPKEVVNFIKIPMNMFMVTRRNIFIYLGDSDEEGGNELLKWQKQILS